MVQVFPNSRGFICRFHFLRDVGKDLIKPSYRQLRHFFESMLPPPVLVKHFNDLKAWEFEFQRSRQMVGFRQSGCGESGCNRDVNDFDRLADRVAEVMGIKVAHVTAYVS